MAGVADVRGVPIWCGRRSEAVAEIEHLIASGQRSYVCCAPVHLVEIAQRDENVRRVLQDATMVLPDGAPVAWAARLSARSAADRVCGSDVFAALAVDTDVPRRHFFYGGTSDVLARIEARLRAAAPTAVVAGRFAPPFRHLTAVEQERDAQLINAAAPDIVWVGLGAPKQDLWMSRMRPLLDAPMLIGVGAVFDFVAGTKPRAPRILQVAGLEWLHRLASEPRRLASRYLRTNTSFILGVTRSLSSRSERRT